MITGAFGIALLLGLWELAPRAGWVRADSLPPLFTALDNGQTLTVFAMSAIVATLGFAADALYVAVVRRGVPWLEGEV